MTRNDPKQSTFYPAITATHSKEKSTMESPEKIQQARETVEHHKAHMAELKSRVDAYKHERDEIIRQARAEESRLRSEIEPLDELLRKGRELSDDQRAFRRDLHARLSQAETKRAKAGNVGMGSHEATQVNEQYNRMLKELDDLEFAATPDDELRDEMDKANQQHDWATKELAHFEEYQETLEEKLVKARASVGEVGGWESDLADAKKAHDSLVGTAYIAQKKPDAKALAAAQNKVADAERDLAEAKDEVDAARAAIPALEGMIKDNRQYIETLTARLAAAAEGRAKATQRFARRLRDDLEAEYDEKRSEIEEGKVNHFRNWQHTESAEL